MKRLPLKRIWKYIKPHSLMLVLGLVCSAAYAVCALLVPVYVGKIVDLFVGKNAVDFSALGLYQGLLGGLAAGATIAQYVQGLVNNRIAFFAVMNMRNDIIAKMQRIPLRYFDAKPSGEIVSSMIADAEALSD